MQQKIDKTLKKEITKFYWKTVKRHKKNRVPELEKSIVKLAIVPPN